MPGRLGFPLGFVLAIVVTFLAVAAGATTHPERAVIALAAVTAAVAGVSTFRATLATAAVCWALLSGFVLGRYGDLVFTPAAARDALVLGGIAIIAFMLTTAGRAVVREIRAGRRLPAIRLPVQRKTATPMSSDVARLS
jgi:hypothetical protein